ncbi:hypothetical protein BD560DRAFT_426830 [Blakeslea trispora]|nr:hypothetical protein BD560DRAFT_426830 [Blakeslea trispora]
MNKKQENIKAMFASLRNVFGSFVLIRKIKSQRQVSLIKFHYFRFSTNSNTIQCDENDTSCQPNARKQFPYNPETFTDDLSFKTLIAAASFETVSNFHEAKVAHPAHPLDLPPLADGQPTRLPGLDFPSDVTSGIDQNVSSSEGESSASGLSRVETVVLSTCGILVVAGIAVGIFVWRNTTRNRQDHSDSDLEYEYDEEQDRSNKGPVQQGRIRLGSLNLAKKEHQHFISTEQQGDEGNEERLSVQEQQATYQDQSASQTLVLTSHHLRNSLYGPMFGGSPSIEPNTRALPSSSEATSIIQSPTMVTYPLQKFLRSPIPATYIPLIWKSPSQSINNISPGGTSSRFSEEYTQDGISETESPVNNQTDNSIGQSSRSTHNFTGLFNKTSTTPKHPISKANQPVAKLSNDNQLAIQIYTDKPMSNTVNSVGFFSPLDLPEDQYVPMKDAIGLPLVSRAEVLADPVRRLGEDEIALWEESKRKKAIEASKQRESTLVSPSTLSTSDPLLSTIPPCIN